MKKIEQWVRPNIRQLKPYSSARNEFSGEASVWLDANESPFNPPYNRYPDPLQIDLKEKLAKQRGVMPENIFLGVGSDEAIDLLYRIFCEPGRDNAVSITPTYGMYRVCADINGVEYRETPLKKDFSLDCVLYCKLSILIASCCFYVRRIILPATSFLPSRSSD